MTPTVSTAKNGWHTAELDSPVDGVVIRFAQLKPRLPPRRALLFLNGRSEWIEKYADLPQWMNLGDDTLWVTLDHRGQGASGGPRAHVASYEDYARDAAAVMAAVARDLPYAIVSHSMGGLVALYGTLHGILSPCALALSSPLLTLPRTPLPHILARPVARLVSRAGYGLQSTGAGGGKRLVFSGNPLTSSLDGFELVCQSPFPYVPPSFGWVAATFAACEAVLDRQRISTLQAPVRIIGGSHEHVIDPAGWSSWCMAAAEERRTPVDFIRVHGGRHELLNEIPRIRRQAVALLRAWLQKHFPPPDFQ